MKTIRKTVTLPEELYEEARNQSGNFSSTVTEALERYLQRKRIERAQGTFGTLPHAFDDEDAVDAINRNRQEGERGYAGRSD